MDPTQPIPGLPGKIIRNVAGTARHSDRIGPEDVMRAGAKWMASHVVASSISATLFMGGLLGIGPDAAAPGTITGDIQAGVRQGAHALIIDRSVQQAGQQLVRTGTELGRDIKNINPRELPKKIVVDKAKEAAEQVGTGLAGSLLVAGAASAASSVGKKKRHTEGERHMPRGPEHGTRICRSSTLTPCPPKAHSTAPSSKQTQLS